MTNSTVDVNEQEDSCVYEGDCLCHEGTTFVTGPAAPDTLCSRCACYLPRGSVTASSERAAGRREAVERLEPWIHHDERCFYRNGLQSQCTCGLTATLEELKGAG